jgi:hypothetical protein
MLKRGARDTAEPCHRTTSDWALNLGLKLCFGFCGSATSQRGRARAVRFHHVHVAPRRGFQHRQIVDSPAPLIPVNHTTSPGVQALASPAIGVRLLR